MTLPTHAACATPPTPPILQSAQRQNDVATSSSIDDISSIVLLPCTHSSIIIWDFRLKALYSRHLRCLGLAVLLASLYDREEYPQGTPFPEIFT